MDYRSRPDLCRRRPLAAENHSVASWQSARFNKSWQVLVSAGLPLACKSCQPGILTSRRHSADPAVRGAHEPSGKRAAAQGRGPPAGCARLACAPYPGITSGCAPHASR